MEQWEILSVIKRKVCQRLHATYAKLQLVDTAKRVN